MINSFGSIVTIKMLLEYSYYFYTRHIPDILFFSVTEIDYPFINTCTFRRKMEIFKCPCL